MVRYIIARKWIYLFEKKLFLPESLSGEEGIVYFSITSPITERSIFTRYHHTHDSPRGRLERIMEIRFEGSSSPFREGFEPTKGSPDDP